MSIFAYKFNANNMDGLILIILGIYIFSKMFGSGDKRKRDVKESQSSGVILLRTLIMTHGTDRMGRTISCFNCTTRQWTSAVPNIQPESPLCNPARLKD